MIGALGPERIRSLQASIRVTCEDAAHVGCVWAFEVVQRISVPGDIENAHDTAVVLLDRADDGKRGQVAAEGIASHPGVGKQIAVISGSHKGAVHSAQEVERDYQ